MLTVFYSKIVQKEHIKSDYKATLKKSSKCNTSQENVEKLPHFRDIYQNLSVQKSQNLMSLAFNKPDW